MLALHLIQKQQPFQRLLRQHLLLQFLRLQQSQLLLLRRYVVGLQRIDEVEEAEIVEGEAEEANAETINTEVSESSEEQASDASDSESDSEQDTE